MQLDGVPVGLPLPQASFMTSWNRLVVELALHVLLMPLNSDILPHNLRLAEVEYDRAAKLGQGPECCADVRCHNVAMLQFGHNVLNNLQHSGIHLHSNFALCSAGAGSL